MNQIRSIDWRKFKVALPLLLAFAVGAASLAFAAFELRFLSFDGADFSYYIVTDGASVRNTSLYRYTAVLLQLPTLLYIHFFGFGNLTTARTILAFSYAWFPVLCIPIAIALCFKYRKPEISLGPLLTFGLVSLPISGLPFGAVKEIVSLFWIVYLIQVYGRRSSLENVALFLLCLPLAFAHETAFLLSALMLALAIWQKYRLAIWIQALSLIGYAIRIADFSQYKVGRIALHAWQDIDLYPVCAAAFLVVILLSVTIGRLLSAPARKWAFRVNFLFGCSVLLYFILVDLKSGLEGTYNTFVWRLYATSLLALIASIFWMIDTSVSKIRPEFDRPFSTNWWRYLYASAFGSILIGAAIDYRGTLLWRSELSEFKKYVNEQPQSCVRIPWKTYKREFRFSQLQPYNVAKVWAMTQEDGIVEKFVYVDAPRSLAHLRKEVCSHLHANPTEIDPGHSNYPASAFRLNRTAFTYSFL